MGKIACLFPGQGAQSVGMGKDLYDQESLPARMTFDEIDAIVRSLETRDGIARRQISELCFAGPEADLKRTLYTQPTILAVSIAAFRCYEQEGGAKPDYVAGHSLGEFSALVAAGALSTSLAVELVDKRARLMDSCPEGAMSAVLGMRAADLIAVCNAISSEPSTTGAQNVVVVANFNTPEQLVLSGSPEAVKLAGQRPKENGAKVIPLPVGGAFHSPLMAQAAKEFEQYAKEGENASNRPLLADARVQVVQNVDAQPTLSADELKAKLLRQMVSAVRWTDTIEYMLAQGVDRFIEIGPGKALSGMVKKINRQAQVFNVSDRQSLEETISALRSAAPVS